MVLTGKHIHTSGGLDTNAAVMLDSSSKDNASLHRLIVMQELLAIQQNGAKSIAFFGTRNMGFLHQQLVEILSYAMVLTGNHIYTSGGLGTNAAVIRGALRAERPDLLTVILPQSLEKQPEELHELLQQVEDLQCMSENDSMKLFDASRCDVSPCLQHQHCRVQDHHNNGEKHRICTHTCRGHAMMVLFCFVSVGDA
jgi:hypothetical protein